MSSAKNRDWKFNHKVVPQLFSDKWLNSQYKSKEFVDFITQFEFKTKISQLYSIVEKIEIGGVDCTKLFCGQDLAFGKFGTNSKRRTLQLREIVMRLANSDKVVCRKIMKGVPDVTVVFNKRDKVWYCDSVIMGKRGLLC